MPEENSLMRFGVPILFILFMLGGCAAIMPASEDYGKRSLGTVWDDQMTETRAKRLIREAHPDLNDAHINVTSFNGIALISGQVPSAEAKELAGATVSKLRHVKTVHNELEIAGPTSLVARTNDSWLTTKVKTALVSDGEVDGNRIKVVTEDGVVFLLGLLTRNEADLAVERARQVYGVQKIVKVFEYIN
jgi:osmotically-inducible protein OsmY